VLLDWNQATEFHPDWAQSDTTERGLTRKSKKKKTRAPDFERIDITNILLSTSIFTAKRITQLTPEVNIETYKALAKFRT
jgi:hypothetical protein